MSTGDTPSFAPTQVGPFQYAEPTAEHRARVLRGVEVKRRLLMRYERAVAAGDSHPSTYARGQDDGYRQACLDAIRDECSVYADHPDYRSEWTL